MEQKINDSLLIRGSTLSGFFDCPQKWYRTYVTKQCKNKENYKALMGTLCHTLAEKYWLDRARKKDFSPMALEHINFLTLELERFQHNSDEFYDPAQEALKIAQGFNSLKEILDTKPMPISVEKKLILDYKGVQLSGTVDGYWSNTMYDIKTSSRKNSANMYYMQQFFYRYLLEKIEGITINESAIYCVVFTKTPYAFEDTITYHYSKERMEVVLDQMIDSLNVSLNTELTADILFRGNPSSYLCSSKWCSWYNNCAFSSLKR